MILHLFTEYEMRIFLMPGMGGRCPSSRGWFQKHPWQSGFQRSVPERHNPGAQFNCPRPLHPVFLNETLYRCRANMLVIDFIKHRRKD
jgi:hypothetical protein